MKLTQEANVAVEEQAQIIHAISEHGETVGAHAEGKANEFFGVEAHVANHVGVHLTGARHFQPTARQWACLKLNVNFGAGFCEGEKAGTEAQHQVVAFKKRTAKIGEHHFQIFEADVLANPQTFALMKHG